MQQTTIGQLTDVAFYVSWSHNSKLTPIGSLQA